MRLLTLVANRGELMNRKQVILFFVLILALTLMAGCGSIPNSESIMPEAESEAASYYPDTEETQQNDDVDSSDLEHVISSMEPIPVSSPSRLGTAGYFEQTAVSGKKMWEVKKDAIPDAEAVLDDTGNPVTIFTGNIVYQTKAPIQREDGTRVYTRFVISGYDVIWLDDDGTIDTPENMWLREETTAKHIYIVQDEQQLEEWTSAWERGQAALNGEISVSKGTIIVNGRILDSTHFVYQNGEYAIPIIDVAKAIYPQAQYESSLNFLSFLDGNGRTVIPFANCNAELKEKMGVANGKYTFAIPGFSMDVSLPIGSSGLMSCSELSQIYGWKFYTDGNILLLITDECDYSNLFVLNTQESGWVDVEVISRQETAAEEQPEDKEPLDDNSSIYEDASDLTTDLSEQ